MRLRPESGLLVFIKFEFEGRKVALDFVTDLCRFSAERACRILKLRFAVAHQNEPVRAVRQ
jgi:hypothetical protein